MSVGVAIDYSQLVRHKTELQQTLDSAALAIAREGSDTGEQNENEIANSFLNANYAGRHSNLKINRDGTAVTVSAVIKPELFLSSFLKTDLYDLKLSSTADSGPGEFEISLVLDTTGSMEG